MSGTGSSSSSAPASSSSSSHTAPSCGSSSSSIAPASGSSTSSPVPSSSTAPAPASGSSSTSSESSHAHSSSSLRGPASSAPPRSGPVPFTGNPGVAADLNVQTPVDCFLQLFDTSVLELIHKETVRYLEQYLEDNKEYLEEHPKARVHELARHPITLDDIKAFITILIGMGICGFPSLR